MVTARRAAYRGGCSHRILPRGSFDHLFMCALSDLEHNLVVKATGSYRDRRIERKTTTRMVDEIQRGYRVIIRLNWQDLRREMFCGIGDPFSQFRKQRKDNRIVIPTFAAHLHLSSPDPAKTQVWCRYRVVGCRHRSSGGRTVAQATTHTKTLSEKAAKGRQAIVGT